jgi:tRNA threonylcarbamoyl adenosine modification protein YjeE
MIDISNLSQTQALAKKLSMRIIEPIAICLKGDLGSGKTTFAQFFIQSKLPTITEVTSPTFTIVQIYNATPPIMHFDLYRLKDPEELYELGIEEAFDNAINLIEWPEIAIDILPKDRIEINFVNKLDSRKIKIEFFGKCSYHLLDE